ncbi:probable E3 ubiquitin-protein ligase HERC6 [Sorex fumeus]|uniref:probable E3 ubiquitin-protein ligase HERC6 n=1 Tax=Sorex fumeus TaxID=62283 RepID=UPI0024AE1B86|nr:probable E3 ubiquitin-protein ligase HERC6 [Sorex fumeus]
MAGRAREQGPSFCWRAGGSGRESLTCGQLLQAASGEGHFLVLLSNGEVRASGDNSRGQLGVRGGAREEPVPIWAAKTLQFALVSCGKEHCLAVDHRGRVYAWGSGSERQLGIGEDTASTSSDIPRLIQSLRGRKIIQVSCGDHHSLALTEGGQLFSWGSNSHGQLGLEKKDLFQAEPSPVLSLQGVPLAQVAAGGAHSFALSLSGTAFGWGSNCAGQLALSDQNAGPRYSPWAVGALRNLGVEFISCGGQHTAVLTQDGKVFTFGDNTYGQLGHSSAERGPQPVEGLSGSVSQIDCGSKHTLVYVYTTGEVVSFGCGPSHTSNPSPPEALAENANTNCLISAAESVNVKHIFAGTYADFVTTYQDESTSISKKTLPEISRINNSLTNKWISAINSKKKGVESEIEAIFSSPACLTASFLKKRKPEESVSIDVDLQRARDTFTRLAGNKKISAMMTSSLKKLVQDLPYRSQHQEALLLFLLLPECPVMHEPSNWDSLVVPFAKAVSDMYPESSTILQRLWKSLPQSTLNTLVQMLKTTFIYQIGHWPWYLQDTLKALLETMKEVYKANKGATCQLPESAFYINQLQDGLDFLGDRRRALVRKQNMLEGVDSILVFSDYLFIFDLISKIKLWQADCYLTMEETVQLERQCFHKNLESPPVPRDSFDLSVRKSHLVEDALRYLRVAKVTHLRKPLAVGFIGETRPKYGGVVSEFFKAVFERMTESSYGMFTYPKKGSCMWFPANDPKGEREREQKGMPCHRDRPVVEKERYYLFGILCGLSLYNVKVAYIPFPLALFKKLLGQNPSLEDLEELSPVLRRNLQEVLNCEGDDIENLHLDFNVHWDQNDVDLIPNGSTILVDQTTKDRYVSEYVNYIFNTSVEVVYKEFQRGFYRVCDESLIRRLFKPEELRQAMIGNTDYDWKQFEKNSVYSENSGYSPSHPTIKMFWEVFHKLSLEEKKKFLFFLTGNDRLQASGMRNIGILFRSPELFCESDNMRSLICYNILDLPKYSTKKRMKEALLVAINNNTGFDPTIS